MTRPAREAPPQHCAHTDSPHSVSSHSDSQHSDPPYSDSQRPNLTYSDSTNSDSQRPNSPHPDSPPLDSQHFDSPHPVSSHSLPPPASRLHLRLGLALIAAIDLASVAVQVATTAVGPRSHPLAPELLLAPGHKADVNVIDFEHLGVERPRVVHDLPAGGRRLLQGAHGYLHTFVSGIETQVRGEPTGERPGRLVRGAQQAVAS